MKWIGCAWGFGLACAYWPGAFADQQVGRWAVTAIALVALIPWRVPVRLHYAGMGLLALACLSVVWAPLKFDAIWELWHWVMLTATFALGAIPGLAGAVFEGAAWGLVLNSALAVGQSFGWSPVDQAASPAGLFGNCDLLSEMSLLVAIPLVRAKRWGMVAALLPSLLLPHCRSAILAGSVVLSLRKWSLGVALAVIGIYYLRYKGFSDPARFAIWTEALSGITWLGHGAGQFYDTYLQYSTHSLRFEHPHNDWLEIAYEFGPLGLVLAAAFAVPLWRESVWLAFCIIALVSFPLWTPSESVLAFLAAGSFYHGHDLVCDWKLGPAIRDTFLDLRRRAHARARLRDLAV